MDTAVLMLMPALVNRIADQARMRATQLRLTGHAGQRRAGSAIVGVDTLCDVLRHHGAMHRQRLSLGTPVGRLAALCLIVATVSATGSTPQAEAMATLIQLIGTATCDEDGQCRTVAVGQRACGGPDSYLAWSVKQSDPTALQEAVTRYNAAQAAGSLPGNRFSICEFVTDPGAVCRAASTSAGTVKSCQLRPRRGASAPPSR